MEVPEDIAKRLESAWCDVSRGALEGVALDDRETDLRGLRRLGSR